MTHETFIAVSNHRIFAASVQGMLFGLTTHPSDKPLNDCLISEASMRKIKSCYQDVLKERAELDKLVEQYKAA